MTRALPDENGQYAHWHGDSAMRPGHASVRFEEGLGWDTDVPQEFKLGLDQSQAAGVRPNHNANVFHKSYQETTRERAHPGSAAWTDAPDHLDSFAQGARDEKRGVNDVDGDQPYGHDIRDGLHYSRPNHARIED